MKRRATMVLRATAIAVLSALSLGVFTAASADARDFHVTVDQAGLIRLPGEAAGVVVGNPAIADATLYDTRTLFVTGKVFGRTNLIVLDGAGRVLYTSDLVVNQADRGLVQVFRSQAQPESFVCAPVCQAVPLIGDDQGWFGTIDGQRSATRSSAESTPAGG